MHAHQTPTPQPQWLAAEVHLQDYLQVLYRRRRVALLAFLLVVMAVAAYTFLARPVFEAQTTLHVQDSKLKGGDLLGELGMARENSIETEIEILKSRTNIEKVVERLHLNWLVRDNSSKLNFKILEFTSQAEHPEYLVHLTGPESFVVTDSQGKQVASGKSGELLRGDKFSLLLQGVKGEAGDSFGLILGDFAKTVRSIRGSIRANEIGRGTNIIQLSYQSDDPQRASEVVNSLAQVYLERAISLKSEEARKSVEFIDNQLDEVRGFLNSAERSLESFKRDSGMIQLDSEARLLVEQLAKTEQERNLLQLRIRQVEFAIQSLQEAISRGEIYAPTVNMDDPVVASLTGQLAELEIEQKGLLAEVTAAHPLALKLQKQIDELERKLLATFTAARQALEVQIGTLQSQFSRGEAKLKDLPQAEQELARLTRLATVNAGIYTFLLQKSQEARIARAVTVSNINVIDPAIVPDRPIKPQKKKNLLLGLVVGVMLGIGLAFFLEYLDDTIKDDDTAKRLLGLPILSTIPLIDLRGGSPVSEGGGQNQRILISHLDPRSPAAEAFRSLRTSVHFASGRERNQVLLVTSAFPGEGKTTISANLALTLAQTGKKILLVGCDLRKPSLHTMFDTPQAPGLTELLIGDCQFSDVLHHTGHYQLDFINAGTIPPNPAELLGGDDMRDLIETQRKNYDTILLDAPPVLAVTDAPVLAGLADQVLTVLGVGDVKVKAAQRTIETLRAVEAPLAGVVLNDRTGKGADYYSYYGYYGKRYGADYSSESAEKNRRNWLRNLWRRR